MLDRVGHLDHQVPAPLAVRGRARDLTVITSARERSVNVNDLSTKKVRTGCDVAGVVVPARQRHSRMQQQRVITSRMT